MGAEQQRADERQRQRQLQQQRDLEMREKFAAKQARSEKDLRERARAELAHQVRRSFGRDGGLSCI